MTVFNIVNCKRELCTNNLLCHKYRVSTKGQKSETSNFSMEIKLCFVQKSRGITQELQNRLHHL